jgi:hypothetical protein
LTAKFVPRILTADQKQQCVNVCTELRQLASNVETFLSTVITGDESWVYGYNPETKRQSSQWKSPTSTRPKKARQVKCNVKSMIITFFDIKGIVHKEFGCDTVHAQSFRQNPLACPITNFHFYLLSNVANGPTSILTDELFNSCNSFRSWANLGLPVRSSSSTDVRPVLNQACH